MTHISLTETQLNIANKSWTVVSLETLKTNIEKHSEPLSLLLENIVKSLKSLQATQYTKQIVLEGTPYLACFLFDQKIIRLYTPHAFLESHFKDWETDNTAEEALTQHLSYLKNHDANPTDIDVTTKLYHLPNLNSSKYTTDIQTEFNQEKQKLQQLMKEYRPSLFEKVSDWNLSLTAQSSLIRVHLLKFLIILPCLNHDASGHQVKKNFQEALRRFLTDEKKYQNTLDEPQLPGLFLTGVRALKWFTHLCPAILLSPIVRYAVKTLAKRFIAGETIEKATPALSSLYKTQRDVTLDQLGELVVSPKEADRYTEEVLNLINGFAQHVPKGAVTSAGIARAHVSIKVSALCPDFRAEDFDYTYQQVAPRLKEILLKAQQEEVFINIDAEHITHRDCVLECYAKTLQDTPELHSYEKTGIVIQAYLKDAAKHLEEVRQLASRRNLLMPVRLVKGAYWDAETIEADAHGFDAPQYLNKEESDINFRQLAIKILESDKHLQLCLASHNYHDHAFAEVIRKQYFSNSPQIEHQCLHMTYEALSTAMAKAGWSVRNYIPVGSLIVGMAYLVRRILENSSQVGILNIMRSHEEPVSQYLPQDRITQKLKDQSYVRRQTLKICKAFDNAPISRLYLKAERESLLKTFDKVKNELSQKQWDNVFLSEGKSVSITSPSHPEFKVGQLFFANQESALLAVKTSRESYLKGEWSGLPVKQRAQVLLIAGQKLLEQRNELACLITLEAGKTLPESLADVDEAIDFINFYVMEELKLLSKHKNLISRGVTAVISPWNFPLAIPCGMAVAPLVAGNTVILKSAEQTPLIAQKLVNILHSSGVPQNAFIHLPGLGEVVGETLTQSPEVSTIVFTGSKQVGTHIFKSARSRNTPHPILSENNITPQIITEMGGKNAIVVTPSADLDEAVAGILYSAFGHAGQKCSACSRLIIHEQIEDKLLTRLREALQNLEVGSAELFSTYINPLITAEDQERVRSMTREAAIEAVNHGGQVIVDRTQESFEGHNVGPALISLPSKVFRDPKSFAHQEFFGPVVIATSYKTEKEAIELFNTTHYALTGGIFSQSQDETDELSRSLECGNLYINRTITGARVGIEPFGGFKMSGTGPKAGHPHYIKKFHLEKSSLMPPPLESQQKVFVTPNKTIPGQKSYNDYSLLTSHLIGCFDNDSSWKKFISQLIGKHDVIYQEVKDVTSLKSLDVSQVTHFFVDSKQESEYLDQILRMTEYETHLPKILTPRDFFSIQGFHDYLYEMSYHRSFAVNIMRHGAPLQMDSLSS